MCSACQIFRLSCPFPEIFRVKAFTFDTLPIQMVLRVEPIAEILASIATLESVNVGACSTIPPLPTAFKIFFSLKFSFDLSFLLTQVSFE